MGLRLTHARTPAVTTRCRNAATCVRLAWYVIRPAFFQRLEAQMSRADLVSAGRGLIPTATSIPDDFESWVGMYLTFVGDRPPMLQRSTGFAWCEVGRWSDVGYSSWQIVLGTHFRGYVDVTLSKVSCYLWRTVCCCTLTEVFHPCRSFWVPICTRCFMSSLSWPSLSYR